MLHVLKEISSKSSFWTGAYLYSCCLSGNLSDTSNFFYQYGYKYLGLAYSVYTHSLIEKVIRNKIDHVIFIAREGFLLEKIYNSFSSYLGKEIIENVTTSYACLSRHSTFLATVNKFTTREIEFGISKSNQQGLFSVFKTYGLPIEPFTEIASEYNVEIKKPIQDYWNDQNLLSFLGDCRVQELVNSYQQIAFNNLKNYLSQCNFFGKNRKVALVDIGWEGTIQNNLVNAFGHREDFPLVYGFYFGKREFKNFLRYSSSFAEGLIFDSRNKDINEQTIDTFVEIFEQSARAPHASTIDYINNQGNGIVEPLFKNNQTLDRKNELLANPIIAVMQQGIVDFADSYKENVLANNYSSKDIKPFLVILISMFINFPTSKEAKMIIEYLSEHSEDLGEETTLKLGLNQFNLSEPLKGLSEFKKACWKQGTMKVQKIPFLLMFYVLKRQLKYR